MRALLAGLAGFLLGGGLVYWAAVARVRDIATEARAEREARETIFAALEKCTRRRR